MHRFVFSVITLLVSIVASALPNYEVQLEPFAKHPNKYHRYLELQKKFDDSALTLAEHRERLKIVTNVVDNEPQWIDGYWLAASESFIIGSALNTPEKRPQARQALVLGKKFADQCLKLEPEQLLCKFFRASLLAKIASIDGIFASLKYGKEIHDTWQEVTEAPYNFNFRPNVTLIGSAYLGLGIFYRLVPDSFFIDLFWNIRGDKTKSIVFHRKAIDFDKNNPCSMLMASVALLCKYDASKEKKEVQEAFRILDDIEKIEPIDLAQAACKHDVTEVRNHPDRTCGYTQATYLKEDEPVPTAEK